MIFSIRHAFVAATFSLLAVPAFAQPFLYGREGVDGTSLVEQRLSMSFPLARKEDAEQQQKAALQDFYRIAGYSCALLTESIAVSCAVTRLNSNVNVMERGGQGLQLMLSGDIQMRVKFKPSTGGGSNPEQGSSQKP